MQQINLFLAEFRPNREPLRAMHMLWGLLGICVLLALTSIYNQNQYTQLLQKLVQVQQTQDAMQTKMQALLAQKPIQANADLDVNIQTLQAELQRRQQIAAMIASQNLGNDKGFSAQLTALAKTALNTLSLETFSLQKGGSYAELSGKTRSADQIPLYLQKLRADASFAHVGFGVLTIVREDSQSGLLEFSLTKTRDDKKNKNHDVSKH